MKIEAPFTPEQVKHLQYWQDSGYNHPFTCPMQHEGEKKLAVSEAGWKCPRCGFESNWAHDFMALGPELDPVKKVLDEMAARKKKKQS